MVRVSEKVFAELVFEELLRYPVCVAVHPAHPLARARKVGLEQVSRERLIAYTVADYPEYHLWLAEMFAPFDRTPQIAEEHDSASSLIAAVEAGRGVAVVLESFKCFICERLKIRRLVPAPSPPIIGIACRKEKHSTAVENFIAAARRAKSA